MHVVHRCRFTEWQPTAVNALAFNIRGNRLAVARANGDVELWTSFTTSSLTESNSNKEEIAEYLARNPISASTANSVVIAAASTFPTASQWHCYHVIPGNGQPVVTGLLWALVDPSTNALVVNKGEEIKERLFSVGLTGRIVEWDLESFLPKFTSDSYGGPIWSAALSPSGCQMVCGCDDGTLRVFDISSSTTSPMYLRALHKHRGRVLTVDWLHHSHIAPPATAINTTNSINGNPNVVKTANGGSATTRSGAWWDPPLVISGGDDGFIRVWNVATAKCLNTIRADARREDIFGKGTNVRGNKGDKDEEKHDGDFMPFDDEDDDEDEEDLEDVGFLPGSKEADIFGNPQGGKKGGFKNIQRKRTGRMRQRNAIVRVKWVDAETAVACDGKGQFMVVEVRLGSVVTSMPFAQKMGAITDIVVLPASIHTASVNHTANHAYSSKYAYQAAYQPGAPSSVGVTYPVIFLAGATGRITQIIATANGKDIKTRVQFGHQLSWVESGAHNVHTHDALALALSCVPLEVSSTTDNSSDEPAAKKSRSTAPTQTCAMLLLSGGIDTNLIMYSSNVSLASITNKDTQAASNTSFQHIRPARVSSFPYKPNTHYSFYTPTTNDIPVVGTRPLVPAAVANKTVRVTPAAGNGNLPLIAACNPIVAAVASTVKDKKVSTDDTEAELTDLYPTTALNCNAELLHTLAAIAPTAAAVSAAPPAAPRVASVNERTVNLYSLGQTKDAASMVHKQGANMPDSWSRGKLGALSGAVANQQGVAAVDVSALAVAVVKTGQLVDNAEHAAKKNTKSIELIKKKITSDSDSDSDDSDAAPMKKKVSKLAPLSMDRSMSLPLSHPLATPSNRVVEEEEADDHEDGDVAEVDIKTINNTKSTDNTGIRYTDGRDLPLSHPHTHLARMTLASRLHVQASALAPNGHLLAAADTTAVRLFTFDTYYKEVMDEELEEEVLVEQVRVQRVPFPPMPAQLQPQCQDVLTGDENEQSYALSCALAVLTQAGASALAFSPDSSMLAVAASGLTTEAMHTQVLGDDARMLINNKFKTAVYLIDLTLYQVVAVMVGDKVLPLTKHVGLEVLVAAKTKAAKKTKTQDSDDSDSDDEEEKVSDVWNEDNEDVTPPTVRHIVFSPCGKFVATADDANMVHVYNLAKTNEDKTVIFAPHVHCVLPQLPQPLTAFSFLPTPLITTHTSSKPTGTTTFDVNAIVKGLQKLAAPAAATNPIATPVNKRGGRASALFTPSVRQGGINLNDAAKAAEGLPDTLATDLLKGLASLQGSVQLNNISPLSPPIIGTLASGCYFIFDTHHRSFLTQGLVREQSRHSAFVPLPFPYRYVELITTGSKTVRNAVKLHQKERITNITVSNFALSRRLKFSLPDVAIGAKTTSGFFQAHVPCVAVMMQTTTCAFHIDLPVSLLCPQLIPAVLRASGNASSTALSRKRKESGSDGAPVTFASQCADSYNYLPQPRMRVVHRYKPLLAMGYSDPHPAAIAGSVAAFYDNSHVDARGMRSGAVVQSVAMNDSDSDDEGEQVSAPVTDKVSLPSPALVVVESPWLNILAQLPAKVFQKKYGKH